jgi:hypothetical protein
MYSGIPFAILNSTVMSYAPTLSAQELIDGLKTGNRLYFDHVFDNYWLRIVYFLGKFVSDEEARKSVAFQVFVHFWNLRETFESENKIQNFLYGKALDIASQRFADSISSLSTRNIENYIIETTVVFIIDKLNKGNNM